MTVVKRLRDLFSQGAMPWWLSDRELSAKKSVGYRYLWSMVAPLDAHLDILVQGLQASWPGVGTPSALPRIGATRGIVRGQADTDEEYGAKLRSWLERWRNAGSQYAIARELHDYLGNHPRVRVINRAGFWVTMAADGTVSTAQATWDWDSVSNPERAGFWSELFIVIYPTQWTLTGNWGDGRLYGARDSGIGHQVTRKEVDAVRGILAEWKAAHTKIRAVIWTSDAALFDPTNPGTRPNGTWGQWSYEVAGHRVASGRNTTTCRYWEGR